MDRKRKTPVSTLLRAIGYSTDEELLELFRDVDNNPEHQYIKTTIQKDSAVTNREEALLEFYRGLRPGEPPNVENANSLLDNLFFNPRRYDLGRVGRYKLSRRLKIDASLDRRTLSAEDIVALLRMMVQINNGIMEPDDIDHLGNRRVRAVGELIQNQIRVGLLRMERVIKERMTTQMDPATTTPAALINIRPVVAARTRVLRRLSALTVHGPDQSAGRAHPQASPLGPGPRRTVQGPAPASTSGTFTTPHYGRICPIETPKGQTSGCWDPWPPTPAPMSTDLFRPLTGESTKRS